MMIVFKNHEAYKVKDGKTRHDPKIEEKIDSLVPFLNAIIEIEEDILFDDFWKYIERDYLIFNTIFSVALGGFDLKLYIDQFKFPSKSREDEDPDNRITYLEVVWNIEINRYKGKDELNISTLFHGWGPQSHPIAGGEQWKGEGGWGLDFTPINDLKGLPFRVKTEYDLKIRDFQALKKGVMEHQQISPKITTYMTVYDVIQAVLYDISFHGGPVDQIRKIQEMDQRVAEAGFSLEAEDLDDTEEDLD